MIKLIYFPLMLLLATSKCFAGPGDGGGGSGLAFGHGVVRFMDLMTSDEIQRAKSSALTTSQVKDLFYKKDRYVKQIGAKDTSFFECAASILDRQRGRFPVLKQLIDVLPQSTVIQVHLRIPTVGDVHEYEKLKLPFPLLSSSSEDLSPDLQIGLATYAANQIWISARMYVLLDRRDRCGLGVHEALRHLNFAGLLEQTLTQKEIEIATRYFMGALRAEDQIGLPALIKKLNAESPNEAYFDRLIAEERAADARRIQRFMEAGRRPNDPEGQKIWDRRQYDIAMLSFDSVEKTVQLAFAKADVSLRRSPLIRGFMTSGIADQAIINGLLTEPLKGEVLDVYSMTLIPAASAKW